MNSLVKVVGALILAFAVGFGLEVGTTKVAGLLFAVKKEKGLDPIVRLVQDNHTFCSGTVVNDTTIITAAHCLLVLTPMGGMMNSAPIEIRTNENKPLGIWGSAYYATTQMDQGLVKGDFRKFDPKAYISDPEVLAKLRKRSPKFTSCGYPLGGNLFCTTIDYKGQFDFMWAGTGILLPGMSGGPSMLEDGTVVAVNVAVNGNEAFVSPIYNLDFSFPISLKP